MAIMELMILRICLTSGSKAKGEKNQPPMAAMEKPAPVSPCQEIS